MDNRIPLEHGSKITAGGREYTIDKLIGRGGTCMVYSGSGQGKVIIKECYPYNVELLRGEKGELTGDTSAENELKEALDRFGDMESLVTRLHDTKGMTNFTSTGIYSADANNTKYLITDICEGETYADYIQNNKEALTIEDIVFPVYLLAHLVSEFHKNGYLVLDIKPDNFLVTTVGGHPNSIQLFDIDSVVKQNDMDIMPMLTYTRDWGAPELWQGKYDDIDERTDIYGIGNCLFYGCLGRAAEIEDIVSFHREYGFEDEACPKCIGEAGQETIKLLEDIFEHTIRAYNGSRYDGAQELYVQLRDLLNSLRMDEAHKRAFAEVNCKLDIWHEEMQKFWSELCGVKIEVADISDKMEQMAGDMSDIRRTFAEASVKLETAASVPPCIARRNWVQCEDGDWTCSDFFDEHNHPSEYKGGMKDGKRSGYGVFKTSYYTYSGNWENDRANGKGLVVFLAESEYKSFEGTFKDNQWANGKVIYSMGYVESYTGEFANNQWSGTGKLVSKDGWSYQGDFQKNMANGEGFITTREGKVIYKGKWDCGRYVHSNVISQKKDELRYGTYVVIRPCFCG